MNNKRVEWKLKNAIMQTITDHGGIVFGGAVRDKYIHDLHATAFFDHIKNLSIDILADIERTRNELYQDKTYMPELHGRFVVPNDIDAYIHVSDMSRFMDGIKSSFPCVTKLFERDIKQYFPNLLLNTDTVVHHRYAIRCIRSGDLDNVVSTMNRAIPSEVRQEYANCFKLFHRAVANMKRFAFKTIYLDLMVYIKPLDGGISMPDPPFGSLDFKCNALILDRNGFRLSNQLNIKDPFQRLKTMTEIMQQIEMREAVVVNVTWYRIKRMIRKDWKVTNLFQHVEKVDDNAAYDGHCLICHERVTDAAPNQLDVVSHMKLKCCDARYHPHCLLNAINNGDHSMRTRGQCAMCSQALSFIEDDGDNLQQYIENNLHYW